MYGIVDQVVVIDSSTNAEYNRVIRSTKRMSKVGVHWAVALGYPDPLRMWALKKCRNDWVLLMDTDERLNDELRNKLKSIISKPEYDAFAIKRYEEVERGQRQSNFFTWQIRLFRKRKTRFRGILHEQPIIDGRVGRLDDGFAIEHRVEHRHPTSQEYYKLNRVFDRLSYATYNEKMLEYVSKLMMPEGAKIKDIAIGRFVWGWLTLYEKITLKKPQEEVANRDYYFFVVLRNLVYALKQHGVLGVPAAFRGTKDYIRTLNEWKDEPDSQMLFEISKEVNGRGVIKYLGLDRDSVVRQLSARYKNKKGGVDLLMSLLKEKYKRDRYIK